MSAFTIKKSVIAKTLKQPKRLNDQDLKPKPSHIGLLTLDRAFIDKNQATKKASI